MPRISGFASDKRDPVDLLHLVGGYGQGPLSGMGREVGVPDLDADRRGLHAAVAKSAADALGECQERPLDDLRVTRVPIERVLVADRPGGVVVPDGSRVDAACALGKRQPMRPEPTRQHVGRQDAPGRRWCRTP